MMGMAPASLSLMEAADPALDAQAQRIAEALGRRVMENGLTYDEGMRLMLAVMTGKTTVSGGTITFRDNADTKNRVTATMTGRNRTSVTLDAD
jgi:hypothetical protein